MKDQRRYHIIIEQKVDVFIQVCEKYIKQYELEKKVWVIKDEEASLVGVGNPDKLVQSKDFGFSIYYEMILDDMNQAIDLFKFKLDHFVKLAQTSDRFPAFKNGKNKDKQTDQEDRKS